MVIFLRRPELTKRSKNPRGSCGSSKSGGFSSLHYASLHEGVAHSLPSQQPRIMRVCYAIARIGRGTNEPVSNWDEGCEEGKIKEKLSAVVPRRRTRRLTDAR